MRLERCERRARLRGADLSLAPVVEAEELVRVAVLLVIVDEPRIRRRSEHRVERPTELRLAGIAVDDSRPALEVPHLGELLDPRERVARVPAEEADGGLHGTARAAVLVAPVLPPLRLARRLEVEVRRASC